MASFLRPTAASWGRNQKEGPNAGTVGVNRRTVAQPPPMRVGTVTSSTSSSTRSGPVRAAGKIAGSASAPIKSTRPASGLMAPTGHQRGNKIETTEERELRLSQEAKERMRKVCEGKLLCHDK